MLDLKGTTVTIPAELQQNRRDHRIFLTSVEVAALSRAADGAAGGSSAGVPAGGRLAVG
jgi:hypothetical protein